MLTDAVFARIRRQADRLIGMELHERHREALRRKAQRLALDLAAVVAGSERDELAARQRLIALLTTKHTAFFRHPHQVDLAAEQALWAVHRRGAARIWSAAAATGEEPWSLAMAVLEVFGQERPPVSILATDVDSEALRIAEAGTYGVAAIAAIPAEPRGRWTTDGRIAPAVRALVRFAHVNLIDLAWPVDGPFDVVCCRNVLMYLGADHRYAILERIAALLASDGLLLLDPSEHLGPASPLFIGGPGGAYALRRRIPRQRAPIIRTPT